MLHILSYPYAPGDQMHTLFVREYHGYQHDGHMIRMI